MVSFAWDWRARTQGRTVVQKDGEAGFPHIIEGSLSAPMHALGIAAEDLRQNVVVARGATVNLADAVAPRIAVTRSLAEYKQWIGVPDTYLDPAKPAADVHQRPSREWSGRRIRSAADLTAQEREDVEKAGRLFLFGWSPWAESYRDVVEKLNAPFRAAVYPLQSLRIAAGGRLIVSGDPSVLLVRDVIIEEGGHLTLNTVCRAWFDKLTRPDAAAH